MKHLLFLFALCFSMSVQAQFGPTIPTRFKKLRFPTLYATSGVIQGDGYAYQCTVIREVAVMLHSCDSVYTKTSAYKDGKPRNIFRPAYDDVAVDDTPMWEKGMEILREAFAHATPDELTKFPFHTILYFDPESGVVKDVVFSFSNGGIWALTPVELYRKLELRFKEELRLVPSEKAKKEMNYLLRALFFDKLPPKKEKSTP